MDIGYMFGIMIKVDTVTDAYFSTSKSYADIIENQEIQFAKMQIEDEFWVFIIYNLDIYIHLFIASIFVFQFISC